ncbi:MAG: helix-turn-helix domain-containing protein [Alphaproteobacteria bacterium]
MQNFSSRDSGQTLKPRPARRGGPPDPRETSAAAPEGSPTLGSILRRLRLKNRWTLKEMSERTGIPLSTLSKVEHDRLTLTYDKLLQLSQNLGIPISDLFSEAEPSSARAVTGRRSIGTVSRSVRVETPNYDYYYLCTELRKKRMVPILTKVRAKTLEEFGELVVHAGEEFVYVLDGVVEVHTEFYDPVILNAGESIYLDSNMGHAYLAAGGCEEATLLGICSSADSTLLESLMPPNVPDNGA